MTFPGGGIYHGTKHAVEAHQRRAALRGARLRRRRGRDRAGADQDAVRRGGRQQHRQRHHATTAPTPSSTRAVAATTAGAYDGPLAKLGGGPETVARKIEKAISRRRPRTRYPVTPSARIILGIHAVLPDRAWDAFNGSNFPGRRRERLAARPEEARQQRRALVGEQAAGDLGAAS